MGARQEHQYRGRTISPCTLGGAVDRGNCNRGWYISRYEDEDEDQRQHYPTLRECRRAIDRAEG